MLENSLTVYDYLRRGTLHYNSLTTGQRAWLSTEGGDIRLNVETFPDTGLGAYQTHLSTLLITLINLRKADPNWVPREMGLAYRSRETFPEIGLCSSSRLSWDTRVSFIAIPRDLLGVRLALHGCGVSSNEQPAAGVEPIPEKFSGLVQFQVESLMSDATFHIDTLAESLSMSRRSLQRKLAKRGLNFSQVLTQVRRRLAADWLETTDKSITDIAFDLGYTDASNFTRAFRWQAGVPPKEFRKINRDPFAASQ
jgi:AraC-like DNA-binding protein